MLDQTPYTIILTRSSVYHVCHIRGLAVLENVDIKVTILKLPITKALRHLFSC